MENCPKGLKFTFSGCKEIHPCVLGQESRMKISKKKDTTPSFLHRGPKKGVEQEYDIHFGQILANKIRTHFFC